MWYDVIINDRSMKAEGFLCTKRPDEPAPEKKYHEAEVLHHDGTFYRDTGYYQDYQQDVEFNFMVDHKHWTGMVRKFRRLMYAAKTVIFQDDPHYYRKVKKVSIGTCARTSAHIGTVTVTFTLDPYHYRVDGNRFYKSGDDFSFNLGDLSHPVYRLEGSGTVRLTVNGYTCSIMVPGICYLDTDKHLCYGDNGENRNSNTNADYERLFLQPGQNQVSVNGDALLMVKPNWREI